MTHTIHTILMAKTVHTMVKQEWIMSPCLSQPVLGLVRCWCWQDLSGIDGRAVFVPACCCSGFRGSSWPSYAGGTVKLRSAAASNFSCSQGDLQDVASCRAACVGKPMLSLGTELWIENSNLIVLKFAKLIFWSHFAKKSSLWANGLLSCQGPDIGLQILQLHREKSSSWESEESGESGRQGSWNSWLRECRISFEKGTKRGAIEAQRDCKSGSGEGSWSGWSCSKEEEKKFCKPKEEFWIGRSAGEAVRKGTPGATRFEVFEVTVNSNWFVASFNEKKAEPFSINTKWLTISQSINSTWKQLNLRISKQNLEISRISKNIFTHFLWLQWVTTVPQVQEGERRLAASAASVHDALFPSEAVKIEVSTASGNVEKR